MRPVKNILCLLMIFALWVSGVGVSVSAVSADETTPPGETAATVEVFGKQVDPNAEILDLNDIPLESVSQVEQILPLFQNLKQVEMCLMSIR